MQIDGGSTLAPDTVIVGSFDFEGVVTGRKIGISHASETPRIFPLGLEALQHVEILVFIG